MRRMSDVFLISADLTGAQRWCCISHIQGAILYPNICQKQKKVFKRSV